MLNKNLPVLGVHPKLWGHVAILTISSSKSVYKKAVIVTYQQNITFDDPTVLDGLLNGLFGFLGTTRIIILICDNIFVIDALELKFLLYNNLGIHAWTR